MLAGSLDNIVVPFDQALRHKLLTSAFPVELHDLPINLHAYNFFSADQQGLPSQPWPTHQVEC
jgi:hypothetical protein